jgi:hypothetical protein
MCLICIVINENKMEKILRKNRDPLRKTAQNFFPFETCEVTATPLEILRSTAYVLAPP